LKNFTLLALVVSVTLLAPAPRAQKLSPDAAAPAALEDRRQALNALFHEYWEDNLKRDPEFASTIGDKRNNDKIDDDSVQAVNDKLAYEQKLLLRLAVIDSTGFTAEEKTSQELLLRSLEQDQEAAEFKEWEMPVNHLDGFYNGYPQLAAELSFDSVKDYDDWIARLHALPKAVAEITENMSIGIDDHRVPPKYLLEKALKQVKDLAAQKPEDSPLAAPLKKFPASFSAAEQQRIKDEMLNVIGKEVLPAYIRFARFLEASYIPAGRDKPGIGALPDGDRYYRFLVRRNTTTDLTPEQIHQIGIDEVARDEAQMLAIAQKLGFKDLASFRASLKSNPKLHPASGEALLAAYQGYVKPMQTRLPEFFGHLPQSPLEVTTVPDYLAPNAVPAYYEEGSPEANRPGRLTVNLYNAAGRNLYSVEAVAYHEGIPGHHIQLSLAKEQKSLPAFRRYGEYTAFVEGWALYAEHLAKDAGFYQDTYSDYGRLEADQWRAIRLVIDTGVHAQGWTRQQMVDYFHSHSNIDEPTIQTEVDRYIAWPGQALAYKIGQMKILELRERARKELGAKFDLRAFHDQVLGAGALPLDVLEQRIDGWIAAQKTGSGE
jgi:uncharacterized protein (DUF885 family)